LSETLTTARSIFAIDDLLCIIYPEPDRGRLLLLNQPAYLRVQLLAVLRIKRI